MDEIEKVLFRTMHMKCIKLLSRDNIISKMMFSCECIKPRHVKYKAKGCQGTIAEASKSGNFS